MRSTTEYNPHKSARKYVVTLFINHNQDLEFVFATGIVFMHVAKGDFI